MAFQSRNYKGHRIEVVAIEADGAPEHAAVTDNGVPELRIDGVPIAYRQLPTGQYFLDDYAYDWHENLVDVATAWIDYQERADHVRQGSGSR